MKFICEWTIYSASVSSLPYDTRFYCYRHSCCFGVCVRKRECPGKDVSYPLSLLYALLLVTSQWTPILEFTLFSVRSRVHIINTQQNIFNNVYGGSEWKCDGAVTNNRYALSVTMPSRFRSKYRARIDSSKSVSSSVSLFPFSNQGEDNSRSHADAVSICTHTHKWASVIVIALFPAIHVYFLDALCCLYGELANERGYS